MPYWIQLRGLRVRLALNGYRLELRRYRCDLILGLLGSRLLTASIIVSSSTWQAIGPSKAHGAIDGMMRTTFEASHYR